MTEGLLFDFPKLKIKKPIRLIELFGGIGSQAMALRDIGANFEYWKLVEFDKYAVASYNAIHNTQHTTHDIRQTHASDLEITDTDKYCYLMTYSFPCTDLSVAGKMQGMSKADWEKGNSTRSGLLWEVERILKECTELPQVLLMENVPQVHADANKQDFENWLAFLRSKGYYNHYKDLNAKDYGIPQNRDRCFCISILSKEFIDYDFPRPIPLTSVMRDYLEEKVDEKYYIKNEKANKLIKQLIDSGVLPEQNRTEQNRLSHLLTCASMADSSIFPLVSVQNMTVELSNTRTNTPVYFRGFRGKTLDPVIKPIDIAATLTTKDDIQNLGTNGVLTK